MLSLFLSCTSVPASPLFSTLKWHLFVPYLQLQQAWLYMKYIWDSSPTSHLNLDAKVRWIHFRYWALSGVKHLLLQNHRIPAWQGLEGPLGNPQPNPLPKQGHPEQAAQHRVQTGLEYLQRRRLHSPSGQPGPGLCHPQREEVLPRFQLELPLLQFVPIAPCPVTGHHWRVWSCTVGPDSTGAAMAESGMKLSQSPNPSSRWIWIALWFLRPDFHFLWTGFEGEGRTAHIHRLPTWLFRLVRGLRSEEAWRWYPVKGGMVTESPDQSSAWCRWAVISSECNSVSRCFSSFII